MHALEQLNVGEVRCWFSTSPPAAVKELLAMSSARPDGERTIICDVNPAHSLSMIIDGFVASFARAALLVWPDWYGETGLFNRCDESSWQSAIDRISAERAVQKHQPILDGWLQVAAFKCRRGEPPIIDRIVASVQLQQMASALADDVLRVIIRIIGCELAAADRLLALARSVEWLSQQVPSRIVVVLPVALHGRLELDSISWNCQIVDESDASESKPSPSDDEPLLMVCPIRGRPHPNSPGEQLMASRLRNDGKLGPLFEYNMPVTSVRGNRYQVDLVWFAGKVVVEIDGYGYHMSRLNFASDRERDYELQLTGYMVLRLTHESVMNDVELAVDKIRDFVKFRMEHPIQ